MIHYITLADILKNKYLLQCQPQVALELLLILEQRRSQCQRKLFIFLRNIV